MIESSQRISVTVPEYDEQIMLYISHIAEVGRVSALSFCVLGLQITNDEIIIADMGKSETGLVYVIRPPIPARIAKTIGHAMLSTSLDFPLK